MQARAAKTFGNAAGLYAHGDYMDACYQDHFSPRVFAPRGGSSRMLRPKTENIPVIIAWHIVVCAYGFWLPNDPRGSGSQYVGSDDLFRVAGRATPVTGG
ncbi:MAG: hypothetical protein ACP5VQ_11380, partial [Phycisphaerae bacterium]